MEFVPDWRRILRRAWSIRLAIIAALFSGAEVVLPMFAAELPRNLFAALSFAAIVGAAVTRLVAQPKMHQ